MTDLQPTPKRIIICCDGTWQSAVSGKRNMPSNVTRLARALNPVARDSTGKVWQQIVWYDSGVGTTSGFLGRKLEGAVGEGLEGNVIEAYNFCVLNYQPGDQILCFGFSRGAYTARAIAGLISDIGICKPSALHHFHEIWELYKSMDPGERFYGSDKFFDFLDGVAAEPEDQPDPGYKNINFVWIKEPRYDWDLAEDASRDIEVVGVYDTVGALGMPSVMGYQPKLLFGPDKVGYHNVRLNRNIKHAFHALALDEHREAFSPTLWHLPDQVLTTQAKLDAQIKLRDDLRNEWFAVWQKKSVEKTKRDEAKSKYYAARREVIHMIDRMKPQSELLQVWFPGVHINIGGGSSDTLDDKGDLEETSNITFNWMLDRIEPHVTLERREVLYEARDLQKHISKLNQKADANTAAIQKEKEDAAKASWGKWAADGLGSIASHVVHPLTWGEQRKTAHIEQGWGTGTIIDSYTLMYRANGSKPRTPGNYVQQKGVATPGETNEEVHPTVGYRIAQSKDYRPAGKDKKTFQRRWNGTRYEYVIEGVEKPMMEFIMKAAPEGTNPMDMPYERYTVLGQKAKEYVRKLDSENGAPEQFLGTPF